MLQCWICSPISFIATRRLFRLFTPLLRFCKCFCKSLDCARFHTNEQLRLRFGCIKLISKHVITVCSLAIFPTSTTRLEMVSSSILFFNKKLSLFVQDENFTFSLLDSHDRRLSIRINQLFTFACKNWRRMMILRVVINPSVRWYHFADGQNEWRRNHLNFHSDLFETTRRR